MEALNYVQKELKRRSLRVILLGVVYVLVSLFVIVRTLPVHAYAGSAYDCYYDYYDDLIVSDSLDQWAIFITDEAEAGDNYCVMLALDHSSSYAFYLDGYYGYYSLLMDYSPWDSHVKYYVDGQEEIVGSQLGNVMLSIDTISSDIRNNPSVYISSKSLLKWETQRYDAVSYKYGDLNTNDIILSSGFQDDVVLTSSGNYSVGSTIRFYVGYSTYTIPIPYYLYFWEDVEETQYTQIVEYYPMSSPDGVQQFDYTFTYPMNYNPMVALGNQHCSTPTASGCVLLYGYSPMLTIAGDAPIEESYNFSFTSSQYTDVLIDQDIVLNWNIDEAICDSFSGAVLFNGHPNRTNPLLNSGSSITSSGTWLYNFDLVPQPLSDFYCPYIEFDCVSGSGYTLYLGGSLQVSNAQCISVYEEEQEFIYPDVWAGGGQSENFSVQNSTGALFQTDKHLYEIGENVKVKYSVYSNSPITKLRLYPHNLDSQYFDFTGDDITQGYNHYTQFSYNTIGEKHPIIKVYSGSTITATIYLGGEEYLDLSEVIIVQSLSLLESDQGIFGLSIGQDLISLPPDSNIFIKGFAYLANTTIKGLLWFASYVFSKIEDLPIFEYVHNLFLPMSGQIKTLPSSYFGYDIDLSAFGDRQFTIDYVDLDDNRTWMLFAVKFIVMFGVIFYFVTVFI